MAKKEEEHIALSLKYRPMTFDDVVGQEHVTRTLRNALKMGRIANAYLFVGPRGIGKTTLSRIFAKALNCIKPNGVEPCGVCENCKQIAQGRSLDVTELDAASHNKVEDVRPIIDAVQFKPAAGKYKIFIIDECHMLTNQAWNALLKTLEEPPPYVRFIFATTEGDKVIATIVSRCQRFDLRRIRTDEIVSRLKYICGKEKVTASEDALLAIARGAEGGMRDALSSLDQLIAFRGTTIGEEDALSVFGLVSRKELEGLAAAILKGDAVAILKAVALFDSAGKNMRRLSAELLAHFRNLVVCQALGGSVEGVEATSEQLKTLSEQAKLCSPGRLFRVADLLAEMEDKLRYALSVRTLMEMTLLKAARIATVVSIEEVMKAVRELEKKYANGVGVGVGVGGGVGVGVGVGVGIGVGVGEGEKEKVKGEEVKVPSQPIPARPQPKEVEKVAENLKIVEKPKPAAEVRPTLTYEDRQKIVNDAKLKTDIMDIFPGAKIIDIK